MTDIGSYGYHGNGATHARLYVAGRSDCHWRVIHGGSGGFSLCFRGKQ